jgi:hypothetical protein
MAVWTCSGVCGSRRSADDGNQFGVADERTDNSNDHDDRLRHRRLVISTVRALESIDSSRGNVSARHDRLGIVGDTAHVVIDDADATCDGDGYERHDLGGDERGCGHDWNNGHSGHDRNDKHDWNGRHDWSHGNICGDPADIRGVVELTLGLSVERRGHELVVW